MGVIRFGMFRIAFRYIFDSALAPCVCGSLARLPLRHWLMRRLHAFRYVLKNKDSGDVFFVVVFTLVLKEDLEKEEAAERSNAEHDRAGKKEQSSKGGGEAFEPKADDLD